MLSCECLQGGGLGIPCLVISSGAACWGRGGAIRHEGGVLGCRIRALLFIPVRL